MPEQPEAGDSLLLRKAQDGNAEAFGCLYERYVLDIYRFLYAHLDSYLDAEDLTEEVFLRAWRALPTYREHGFAFSAFLFRIARNVLIDHYRSNHNTKTAALHEDSLSLSDLAHPGEPGAGNLEHHEVNRLLQKLKPEYRTVLVARFISGLSPEETAQAMGKSPGAVRVLQHRALAALRKLID